MENLKSKATRGVFWSLIDNLSNQGLQFVIGLVLARLLGPAEFGLIGMVTVFVAVSQIVLDSGFSQALIRKREVNDYELRSVFSFNVGASLFLYAIIWIAAPFIAAFYKEPSLTVLVRVVSISIVINAFGVVQSALLQRDIDFKRQAKISITASLVSGVAGVSLAYNGWGVWSLVFRTLMQHSMTAAALWYTSGWKVRFGFQKQAFRELFGFGNKLMIAGVIDALYQNMIYLVIGRVASVTELGYYNRAEQFKNLPSKNISSLVSKVSYPILSKIEDPDKLKDGYARVIRLIMLITFAIMLYMVAISDAMIGLLLGEKWMPVSGLFQLISVFGMLYPLHALNLNMLKVKGRSDLYLMLESIKKILAVPVIIVGIYFGLRPMIYALIVNSFIALVLNSFWSGKLVNYSLKDQLIDIRPQFFTALGAFSLSYLVGVLIELDRFWMLLVQTGVFWAAIVLLLELTRNNAYLEMKNLVLKRIPKFVDS